MNSSDSPGTFLPVIKRHPVAAFIVIAISLSWIGQILSLLLLGNILPGILAELLNCWERLSWSRPRRAAGPLSASSSAGQSAGGLARAGTWQRCWPFRR